MLMQNTVQSALKAAEKLIESHWHLRPLTLKLQTPVPSDIDIARSQEPKDILTLSEEIGLCSSEVSLYGNKKAKLSLKILDRLSHQEDGNSINIHRNKQTYFYIFYFLGKYVVVTG
jgi:methylenetetrahydrofolate dehydrogenase (NADP+)/methenyltetrahydrofolate cyclohydrolase/formyltetrahydrofolate synthetase